MKLFHFIAVALITVVSASAAVIVEEEDDIDIAIMATARKVARGSNLRRSTATSRGRRRLECGKAGKGKGDSGKGNSRRRHNRHLIDDGGDGDDCTCEEAAGEGKGYGKGKGNSRRKLCEPSCYQEPPDFYLFNQQAGFPWPLKIDKETGLEKVPNERDCIKVKDYDNVANTVTFEIKQCFTPKPANSEDMTSVLDGLSIQHKKEPNDGNVCETMSNMNYKDKFTLTVYCNPATDNYIYLYAYTIDGSNTWDTNNECSDSFPTMDDGADVARYKFKYTCSEDCNLDLPSDPILP